MKIVFAVLLTFTPLLAFSQAQEFPETSGNAFLRLCPATEQTRPDGAAVDDSLKRVACIAYVKGVADGIELHSQLVKTEAGRKAPGLFCIPDGVENGQLVDIVLKYIRDNPEDAQRRTVVLIAAAFEGAFPCESQ